MWRDLLFLLSSVKNIVFYNQMSEAFVLIDIDMDCPDLFRAQSLGSFFLVSFPLALRCIP